MRKGIHYLCMPMQTSPAEHYKNLVGSWKDQSTDYLACRVPLESQNRRKWLSGPRPRHPSLEKRSFIDITSMKERSLGGSKFWALIVDDYSDYLWGRFFNKKSDLSENVMPIFKEVIHAREGSQVHQMRQCGRKQIIGEEMLKSWTKYHI